MSAFLGPIHDWMYGKIQTQEQLTDRMLAFAESSGWGSLSGQLEHMFGKREDAPLEQLIDHTNIHGWLSQQVARAEERFAQAIKLLLETNRDARLNALIALFEQLGQERAVPSAATVGDAYQAADGLLLDGMPCDGGRHVTNEDADELVWAYDAALHPLCSDSDGFAAYTALREAFLRGMLCGSALHLEPLGGTVYRFRKGA